MINDAPDQLSENVIHEFYSNRNNYKLKHSTRRNHNTVTLDALSIVNNTADTGSNNDVKTTATTHFSEDSSFDDDLTTESSMHQYSLKQKNHKKQKDVHSIIIDNSHSADSIVKSRMTKQLKPLVISYDSHRIGHLMHKVSAVSGYSILAGTKGNIMMSSTVLDLDSSRSTMKKSHSSPTDISASSSNIQDLRAVRTNDVSKYQLKIMQESVDLKEHIGDVLHLHDHLSTIIVEQLTNRAELAKAVGSANDRYLELFELILSEMLKTQRLKFKVRG